MESKRKIDAPNLRQRAITALIVDDETGAINTLRGMLQQYCPQIQVAEAATSVEEAVIKAHQIEPDLVFLDIEMPPVGSGFDVLKQCPELNFGVVFTTAYPEYAIQAINTIQPWAYLVKPYSVSELKKAVGIAEEKVFEKNQNGVRSAVLIVQDSRKGALVLRAEDILFCKAGGSFTEILVAREGKVQTIISSRNLGENANDLPAEYFCRTHHSYLVNLNYVERLERTGRNGIIHFRGSAHRAYVSVSKMDEFQQALENFSLQ